MIDTGIDWKLESLSQEDLVWLIKHYASLAISYELADKPREGKLDHLRFPEYVDYRINEDMTFNDHHNDWNRSPYSSGSKDEMIKSVFAGWDGKE